MTRLGRVAVLIVLVLIMLPSATSRAQERSRTFPETGYTLRGAFLEYWERNGGLAVFGYPVSAEVWEDGRVMQYLERNRFELHPDNAPPFNVLLGLLGDERLQAQHRNWRTQQPGRAADGCLFFPETQHSLCGEFRTFWERNGGLAVFGFPITEPALETSETDGNTYSVQYFERNRFELHPENAPPFNVLLGLLGRWRVEWLLDPSRQSSPYRATISGPQTTLAPLDDYSLTINVPNYSGPATIRIVDPAGHVQHLGAIQIDTGSATFASHATGALGSHAAVVLIDGRIAGINSAAYRLDAQTNVATSVQRYDTLVPKVREFLSHDVSEYEYQGYHLRGYRSPDSDMLWLRDHVYQGEGYRYFDPDMTSLLDYFRRQQQTNGAFDDYFARHGDAVVQGRIEVEADLEFLFVQGVYQAWQATGDTGWLRANLDAMQRGIGYSTSDVQRWDADRQLIKRPFTIDTWDFEYGGPTIAPDGKVAPRHWIDDQTKWGIMHGDNTGMAYAMLLMSRISTTVGDQAAAVQWATRSAALKARLDTVAWNGAFYRHTVHLTPVKVPDVDEAQQLSLSNAYALNREVLAPAQAQAIIAEYYRRRSANPDSLASEWYSIDPPFPARSFGTKPGWGNVPGEYVNGGKMPLVGGELARGAFRYGHEGYGFDILKRYAELIALQGGTYLWYYPAGNPGIPSSASLNTDGWGSSAMLAALLEGAAGITDDGAVYRSISVAPRWTADPDVQQASVVTRYAASFGYVAYSWQRNTRGLTLQMTGSGDRANVHLLLPADVGSALNVQVNGVAAQFRTSTVGGSRYVDLTLASPTATINVSW